MLSFFCETTQAQQSYSFVGIVQLYIQNLKAFVQLVEDCSAKHQKIKRRVIEDFLLRFAAVVVIEDIE